MSIFSRFRSSKTLPSPVDFGLLGADMHSHLIPGVDDGAPDLNTSLGLIRSLTGLGYRRLITTPHIMVDYYPNTSGGLRAGAEVLRAACRSEFPDLILDISAEYYADSHFMELILADDLMPFGDRYILLEVSFASPPDNLNNFFFELQHRGYRPILAHPERYPYWVGDLRKMRSFADRDVLLQLNINSLTGTYSPQVAKFSEQLLDSGLISFLGTDCHHPGHIHLTEAAARNPALHRYMETGKCLNPNLLRDI